MPPQTAIERPRPALKPGMKCSVCAHLDLLKINRAIADGRLSMRKIATKYGLTEAALNRHRTNDLTTDALAAQHVRRLQGGVDVWAEFEDQLDFAKQLREAAKRYLSNPDDPLRMDLIPRAEEIDVTYLDHTDLTKGENPQPKKKVAKLSHLLVTVESLRNLDVDKVQIKHVDLRKFALDAINTTDTCIDKFARLTGSYQQDKPNESAIDQALKGVGALLKAYTGPRVETKEQWVELVGEMVKYAPVLRGREGEIEGMWDMV